MPNVPVPGHPLLGTEQAYLPPGKTPDPAANTPPDDTRTVARHGDTVIVREMYENWNGVPGLTMAYVYVPSTGYHTHLTPRDMGLSGYGEPSGGGPQPATGQVSARPGGGRRRPARDEDATRRSGRGPGGP